MIRQQPGYDTEREAREARIANFSLSRKHGSKFGIAEWRRNGSQIEIAWSLLPRIGRNHYKVGVAVIEVFLHPAPGNIPTHLVAYSADDGSRLLQLEEGRSYLLHFKFIKGDLSQSENPATDVDDIYLPVSIPLSSESSEILRSADAGNRTAFNIKQQMETFVAVENAFETILEEQIENIKSLGLPLEKERERIENLSEFAALLREKLKA